MKEQVGSKNTLFNSMIKTRHPVKDTETELLLRDYYVQKGFSTAQATKQRTRGMKMALRE